jgi:peptide/nickel transport system substrate-binding protein
MMSRFVTVSCLLIALFLVFGCTAPDGQKQSGTPTQHEAPVQGDTVIVQYNAEPDTFNPVTRVTANSGYALFGANNSLVYEYLLQYDPKAWTLTEPLLAASYPEVSEDRLTYTYTIREGVHWHDGRLMTPDDVLFSFKATMSPLVDAAHVRGYFSKMKDVELLEGRKIRFSFTEPDVLNIQNTSSQIPVFAKHIFDPQGLLDGLAYKDIISPNSKNDPKIKAFSDAFNKHPNNRIPIGTGPYKFEKWDSGKEVVLARNDAYWGRKAYLDKLVLRTVLDPAAALTALKAGELDLVPRLQPVQYTQQTSGQAFEQEFKKTPYALSQYYYIGWNEERPFFKDKRVRQAMTMLVNRDQIIENVRFGLAKPAASHFLPQVPLHNPNIKPWPYDPKRAAALLDEAGWTDHDGDGVRDKDGVKFKFEFLGSSGNQFTAQLVAILKDEFRKAGIEMTERLMDFNLFLSTALDHKLDAAASAWNSPLESDPHQIFHSSASLNRGSNFISFKNAESDRLLEQGRLEFDPEKRKQIYWQWQELIHEEQPYTFLFYALESAAYHRRFENVEWLPNRPGYDLTRWFVPKAAQKSASAKNF